MPLHKFILSAAKDLLSAAGVPSGVVIPTLSKPKGKTPRILLAPALLLLLVTSPLRAQTDPTLLKRVDDHYNHLRSLRAHFSQHYTGLGADRTETGTLLLRKPGLMRWSYDQPPGKLFVLDGHFAWFFTPGDAQVTRTPAKQLDDLRSPLRLLLGHTQLSKELDNLAVTPEPAPGPASPPAYRITGIPKGMADRVRLLTLIISPDGAIQRMTLEETDGATTGFAFTAQQENVPTTPADFTFLPPPGIAIVDGQSPL